MAASADWGGRGRSFSGPPSCCPTPLARSTRSHSLSCSPALSHLALRQTGGQGGAEGERGNIYPAVAGKTDRPSTCTVSVSCASGMKTGCPGSTSERQQLAYIHVHNVAGRAVHASLVPRPSNFGRWPREMKRFVWPLNKPGRPGNEAMHIQSCSWFSPIPGECP